VVTATSPPQPGPSPDLKRRVLAAVQSEPAPTQHSVRQRGWLTFAICAGIALAIFAYFGGVRTYDRPGLLVAWTCVGWILAASAAAAFGVARGRSMLGRSTVSLVMLIIGLPLAVLAWKIGVTVPFGPEMMAPWPGRPGFRCLGLSLATAAPLLVAFVVIRRRSDPVHPGIAGAVLGIAAGIAAGTLVDLWCPIAHLPHVLLGHILPLLLVASVGAWAGRRLLPP
jgi:hypothetical protein